MFYQFTVCSAERINYADLLRDMLVYLGFSPPADRFCISATFDQANSHYLNPTISRLGARRIHPSPGPLVAGHHRFPSHAARDEFVPLPFGRGWRILTISVVRILLTTRNEKMSMKSGSRRSFLAALAAGSAFGSAAACALGDNKEHRIQYDSGMQPN